MFIGCEVVTCAHPGLQSFRPSGKLVLIQGLKWARQGPGSGGRQGHRGQGSCWHRANPQERGDEHQDSGWLGTDVRGCREQRPTPGNPSLWGQCVLVMGWVSAGLGGGLPQEPWPLTPTGPEKVARPVRLNCQKRPLCGLTPWRSRSGPRNNGQWREMAPQGEDGGAVPAPQ